MRHLLFATVLVTFAAAGMQPRQAASFDPAGKWTYSTHDDQGAPISGTMEIAGKPGAYTGTIVSGPGRELKVSDVLTSPNGMDRDCETCPMAGVAVVKVWKDADGNSAPAGARSAASSPRRSERAKSPSRPSAR
jgi:hypothetical protein